MKRNEARAIFISSLHEIRSSLRIDAWQRNNLYILANLKNCKIKQPQNTPISIAFCCWCYCCSVAKSCATLFDPMNWSMPGFPVLYYLPDLLKFMSIESMMPSNDLILCNSFLSSCPQSFQASGPFLFILKSFFLSLAALGLGCSKWDL